MGIPSHSHSPGFVYFIILSEFEIRHSHWVIEWISLGLIGCRRGYQCTSFQYITMSGILPQVACYTEPDDTNILAEKLSRRVHQLTSLRWKPLQQMTAFFFEVLIIIWFDRPYGHIIRGLDDGVQWPCWLLCIKLTSKWRMIMPLWDLYKSTEPCFSVII